jgi:hypothetical protein
MTPLRVHREPTYGEICMRGSGRKVGNGLQSRYPKGVNAPTSYFHRERGTFPDLSGKIRGRSDGRREP